MVEKFVSVPGVPGGGHRVDLFGFADILAFNRLEIILIQSCGSDFLPHLKKIKENEIAKEWLACGYRIELIGWRKLKNRLKAGGYGKYIYTGFRRR